MTAFGLLNVLREPTLLQRASPSDWDLLFREAMQADLAFHLPRLSEEGGASGQMPAALRWHLQGLQWKLDAHREEVIRECQHLREVFAPLGLQPVLLKGAGYGAAGLLPARYRLFSDIDLLVPWQQIDAAEQALLIHGWVDGHPDPHDQAFYRQWMHELPPLTHLRRQTTLDLHHTITPRTSRWPVSGDLLWSAAVPAAHAQGFQVLAPADMVLHCIVHILLNEDLRHGLRDLVDLGLLLRTFSNQDPAFWDGLSARAQALGLQQLLAEGLALAHRVVAAEVPVRCQQAPSAAGRWRVRLWQRALRPRSTTGTPWLDEACRALHYAAALRVRMPLLLSVQHFSGKGWRALRKSAQRTGIAG